MIPPPAEATGGGGYRPPDRAGGGGGSEAGAAWVRLIVSCRDPASSRAPALGQSRLHPDGRLSGRLGYGTLHVPTVTGTVTYAGGTTTRSSKPGTRMARRIRPHHRRPPGSVVGQQRRVRGVAVSGFTERAGRGAVAVPRQPARPGWRPVATPSAVRSARRYPGQERDRLVTSRRERGRTDIDQLPGEPSASTPPRSGRRPGRERPAWASAEPHPYA